MESEKLSNFNNDNKDNWLEELKNRIIAHQGMIEEAERNHTANEYTLKAWKEELKSLESEWNSLTNSSENEITLNFD
ncbi:MAG: hypothetical protein ACI38O_08935 [Fibrobacter intestinalis]|uniref:hypothetical protein n=1 Tax=Fibrobacter intestinalis TaxID=28122 RepID=UPI003F0F9841